MEKLEDEIAIAVNRVTRARNLLDWMEIDPDEYADEINVIRLITNRRQTLYRRKAEWEKIVQNFQALVADPNWMTPEEVQEAEKKKYELENEMIVLCYRIGNGFRVLEQDHWGDLQPKRK